MFYVGYRTSHIIYTPTGLHWDNGKIDLSILDHNLYIVSSAPVGINVKICNIDINSFNDARNFVECSYLDGNDWWFNVTVAPGTSEFRRIYYVMDILVDRLRDGSLDFLKAKFYISFDKAHTSYLEYLEYLIQPTCTYTDNFEVHRYCNPHTYIDADLLRKFHIFQFIGMVESQGCVYLINLTRACLAIALLFVIYCVFNRRSIFKRRYNVFDYVMCNNDRLNQSNLQGLTREVIHELSYFKELQPKGIKYYHIIKGANVFETVYLSILNMRKLLKTDPNHDVNEKLIDYIILIATFYEFHALNRTVGFTKEGKKGSNKGIKTSHRNSSALNKVNQVSFKKAPYTVQTRSGSDATYDKVYSAKELSDLAGREDLTAEYFSGLVEGSGFRSVEDFNDMVEYFEGQFDDNYYATDYYGDFGETRYIGANGQWIDEDTEVEYNNQELNYDSDEENRKRQIRDDEMSERYATFKRELEERGDIDWADEYEEEGKPNNFVILNAATYHDIVEYVRHNAVLIVYRKYDEVSLPALKEGGNYYGPLLAQVIASKLKRGGEKVNFIDCLDTSVERQTFLRSYRSSFNYTQEGKPQLIEIPQTQHVPVVEQEIVQPELILLPDEPRIFDIEILPMPVKVERKSNNVYTVTYAMNKYRDGNVRTALLPKPKEIIPESNLPVPPPKSVEPAVPKPSKRRNRKRPEPALVQQQQQQPPIAQPLPVAVPVQQPMVVAQPIKPAVNFKNKPVATAEIIKSFFDKTGKTIADFKAIYFIPSPVQGKKEDLGKYAYKCFKEEEARPKPQNVHVFSAQPVAQLEPQIDPEAKMKGTITLATDINPYVGYIIRSIDPKVIVPPVSNDDFLLHCTGIKTEGRLGFITAKHGYVNAPSKFIVKTLNLDGIVVDKSKTNAIDCGKDLIFVELAVPGLRCYSRPMELKDGQVRIVAHATGFNGFTSSISAYIKQSVVWPGQVLEAEYNSERGTCGAPILDCENHLYGIHIGTWQRSNVLSMILWSNLDF